MLDVCKLQALLEVARHGSIAAAATVLHFTPSAVSQRLAALERETGSTLFVRTGRSIQLTQAGAVLAAHADLVVGQLAAAQAALDAARTPTGPLRIAAFPSAIAGVVAEAVGTLQREQPQLSVSVIEAEPEQAEPMLRAADVDVAIVHHYDLLPRSVPDTIVSEPIFDEPMYVVTRGADQSSRAAAAIDLGLLAEDRWIVPRIETTCHELVRRACGAEGFVPIIAAQCTDHRAMLALVRAGVGVALVPSLAFIDQDLTDLVVREPQRPLRRYVHAQYVRSRELPATAPLLRTLAEAADVTLRAASSAARSSGSGRPRASARRG